MQPYSWIFVFSHKIAIVDTPHEASPRLRMAGISEIGEGRQRYGGVLLDRKSFHRVSSYTSVCPTVFFSSHRSDPSSLLFPFTLHPYYIALQIP